jgi:glycosyltransferase involved in cell wall biosynthesis
VYRRADMVVTLTEEDRWAVLRAIPEALAVVVPTPYPVACGVPDFMQRIPRSLLFVGGFRHLPNVDAMLFFCREVLPLVRRSLPDVALTIVGDSPPEEVAALATDGITVTGWVPHVEPYLASHCVSIAPLRFGAGLKGKIVEAMASGMPVVTTSIGAEGMELVHGHSALIADSPEELASSIVRACTDGDLHARLSRNGLAHARARWDPIEVAPRLLETMARLGMLTAKRLGTMDRWVVKGQRLYEASGAPARVERLSSRVLWYSARLRTVTMPRAREAPPKRGR